MRAVFKKELYRIFSDPKLVFTTFFLSPIIMIVIIGVIALVTSLSAGQVDQNIPEVLINNPPVFLSESADQYEKFAIQFVQDKTVQELGEKYKKEKWDLILSFPKEFDQAVDDFERSSFPVVDLIYDSTNDFSNEAYKTFDSDILEPYKHKILVSRIKDENYLTVFDVQDKSLELKIYEEKQVVGKILSKFLPYMLFITMFGSAMGLVIESIAGEKERGTLATQLLTPIPRQNLAFGKLFGLSFMSVTSTVVSILFIAVVGLLVILFAGDKLPGVVNTLSYSFVDLLTILAILIPSVLMNTSMLMAISAFGKNMKEASGYVMPLYILTIIVSTIPMNMVTGDVSPLWQYMIPIFGQVIALMDIFKFNYNPLGVLFAAIIPIVITFIMIFIIRNIFNNERMIVSD